MAGAAVAEAWSPVVAYWVQRPTSTQVITVPSLIRIAGIELIS